MIHASKDDGKIVVTSFDEFAEGQQVNYTRQPVSWEEQQTILQRANGRIGAPYNLLNANCEDFVTWVVTGKAQSPQRNQHFAFAIVVIGVGLLLRGVFGSAE